MATVSNHLPWEEFQRRHGFSLADGNAVVEATDELFCGFMDDVAQRIRRTTSSEKEVNNALEELFHALLIRRNQSSGEEWDRFVKICRRHPLRKLVHEDPFTFRAYSKPRRYAGDAVMMDYIYAREELWPEPPASRIGQRVFRFSTGAPASEGVRARRGHIADVLDNLANEQSLPHVLSIASGHLREASMSSAVRRRRLGRLVAMDADPLSLREVDRCYGGFGVETVPASIRKLLTGRMDMGHFDMVYTTGLFDYLKPATGRRLTSSMFSMLNSGGRLLIANFLPNVQDIGYMEVFMDWFLVYRKRQEMVDLTEDIPESEIRDVRLVSVENKNILFLEVTRN